MKYRCNSFLSRICLRLLMAVLLSSPFSVAAQQETAFPNEYATWDIGSSWIEIGDPPAGNQLYTRLDQIEAVLMESSDSLMMLYYDGMPIGDYYSTTDKVYFKFISHYRPFNFDFNVDTGVYYPLYDFTLEVGDTAYPDSYGAGPPYYITVDSITMEEHNGAMLKHFHLSNSDIIIEKIGSIEGLFRPYSSSFEMNQTLCSYGGSFVTGNSGTGYSYSIEDCLPSGMGLENYELNSLTAYPNPADNLMQVTSSFPISTCRVYSTIGTMVKIPTEIQENNLELVVSGLSSGSYFLELTGHNGISQRCYFMKN